MSLVKLIIKGISYSQTQNGAYALILNEVDGERKLPIVIGAYEAQAIAIGMETNLRPPRPLTHDLIKNIADRYNILIKQVIIHKLVDGVFYSTIICEQDGIEEIIDARTSDAIALAIRFDAPIFTYQNILEKAGTYMQVQESETPQENIDNIVKPSETSTSTNVYESYSIADLYELLEKAVQNEDYELAAQIRDEISKKEP